MQTLTAQDRRALRKLQEKLIAMPTAKRDELIIRWYELYQTKTGIYDINRFPHLLRSTLAMFVRNGVRQPDLFEKLFSGDAHGLSKNLKTVVMEDSDQLRDLPGLTVRSGGKGMGELMWNDNLIGEQMGFAFHPLLAMAQSNLKRVTSAFREQKGGGGVAMHILKKELPDQVLPSWAGEAFKAEKDNLYHGAI